MNVYSFVSLFLHSLDNYYR